MLDGLQHLDYMEPTHIFSCWPLDSIVGWIRRTILHKKYRCCHCCCCYCCCCIHGISQMSSELWLYFEPNLRQNTIFDARRFGLIARKLHVEIENFLEDNAHISQDESKSNFQTHSHTHTHTHRDSLVVFINTRHR